MQEKIFLSKVEKVLSEAWGGDVHVAVLEQMDEHQHVWRLAIQGIAFEAPQTAILKRWRGQGEERFSAEFSASHFFNDWAGLEFLSTVLGDESPAPEVYAGDQNEGFFVMEDIPGTEPLQEALWNRNPSQATDVLIRYGEFLGSLHGQTSGYLDTYPEIRQRLSADHSLQPLNYFHILQKSAESLEKWDVAVPASARDDLHEIARILSQPRNFTAFTHGDPIYSNVIQWQGSWRLIDFEAARLRHALWEGIYPRMFFPTSGLKYVQRIPEDVWRQAEAAYRTVLGQSYPAARDDQIYGTAMAAACAFWVLDFCQRWHEIALAGNAPPVMVKRIRQCMMVRSETFVMTSQEYQSLVHLGTVFEKLVAKLRSRWIEEDCDLPFYPAFT